MFSRIKAIRRERGLNMAVGSNGFIRTVARFPALELVDVLADQVAFDAVAGDERQAFLKDFKFAEGRNSSIMARNRCL